ncbi:rod shape-determining protein MreC [uncultured Tyzzerella sp.]|uniref:rod shape-determining protein MreC n=1 Tax=uncultured Tyzzerella sp. TaxID=2321398 RepID=UPI00294367F5|nr:rod shape-determining protein MreC [uncultured Tyzzerella sp.]
MKVFLKNKKIFVGIFIILCIFLGLFSFNRLSPTLFERSFGFIITPIQNAITSSNKWLGKKIKAFSDINKLEKENEDLKLELELKSQEISRLKQLERENKKLSELLDASSKYGELSTITSNIIAKDPGNWYETFIIDKGAKDGIEKNMVVLAFGGLVGKVEEVGDSYAKVSSIINGTYSVTSKTLRSDDEGFVKGDIANKGMLKMDYIDKDAEIKEGDEIVTSHLSDIYPAGITIGSVTEIHLDTDNKLSKTATIKPAVDFKHLEKVLIINKSNK